MNEEKIDFVMIWVDNNDIEWQKEKNKYLDHKGDNRNVRFRDWNTLKYWFRSIEKYANWVNNIFFVTCGHIPEWLNIDNPKIHVVKHSDFIPKEYLPTFSSHVIELNLHRIKNLNEQFVYFNDDVFIFNNVKKTDFFVNGIPKDSAILSPAIEDNKNGIGNVELNNMAIINTYFNKNNQLSQCKYKWFNLKYGIKDGIKNVLLSPWNSFTSFYEFHISNNFLKKTYEEIWEKEYDILNETCMHKFRNLKLDVNQWLIRDWQLASNNFIPRSTCFGKLYTLSNESDFDKIFSSKNKIVCLNDSDQISDENFEKIKNELTKKFEIKFPVKSKFEK